VEGGECNVQGSAMYWEELCFVMTTVTDNKFCTISEPKNSTFSCVSMNVQNNNFTV
jgi:hypothetical protein